MPTVGEWCGASLANVSIWSGTLRQDILQAGGTWPPAGTRTTSGLSVTPATSQTKDDSGVLVRLLTESSLGEQRRLWKKLCPERRTAPTPYKPLSNTTRKSLQRLKEKRTFDGSGALVRSDEELKEIERLRAERKELMLQHEKTQGGVPKNRISQRVAVVNGQLFELTEDEIYNK